MSSRPRMVTIPSRDVAFGRAVQRLAAAIPDELDPESARAWLEDELRRDYPTVEVREQDELARPQGGELVWYASRGQRSFRIDVAIHVPLVPEAAFELYTGRVVEWQTAVQLVPLRVTPEIAGSEYAACYRFLGVEHQGTLRVLAVDAPRAVTIEAAGSGIRVWYETTFSPIPGGTTVTVKGDYDLPNAFLARVADRLGMERAIARDIERANEAYRRLCEAEAAREAAIGVAARRAAAEHRDGAGPRGGA